MGILFFTRATILACKYGREARFSRKLRIIITILIGRLTFPD